MQKVVSFTIDHTKLLTGVYVSRIDAIGQESVTTFDIRVKRPNVDDALTPESIHTLEHLGATFLRNHEVYKDKTVYFGPMGCLTGFYWIVKGNLKSDQVIPVLKELFAFMASFEGNIPGASAVECGNYQLMN